MLLLLLSLTSVLLSSIKELGSIIDAVLVVVLRGRYLDVEMP
jgi:hypothetical protein